MTDSNHTHTALTKNFGQISTASSPGGPFTATGSAEIMAQSEAVFEESLDALAQETQPLSTLFGLSGSEAVRIYRNLRENPGKNNSLWDIRQNLSGLTNEQLAAVMHIENVRGFLKTGAHVIADRNLRNTQQGSETFSRAARRQALISNFETMAGLGWDAEKMRGFFRHVKIWLTYTPHPTKDKNPEGDRLYRLQAYMADNLKAEDRASHMRALVGEMLRTPLTPRKKDTLPEESQEGLNAEHVYVEGMLDYLEDLQSALDAVYGPGVVDLTDPDALPDIAPRDWHSGDADGKEVPAPMFFAKHLRGAHMALKSNIALLTSAELSASELERLQEILEVFTGFESRIDALYGKIDYIRHLKSTSEQFEKVKEEFVEAFTAQSYKGKKYERGPELTAEIMKDLKTIARDQEAGEKLRSIAWRMAMRHRQVGVAMGRQEIRHNSRDYETIFANLYTYLRASRPDVLKACLGSDIGIGDLNHQSQTVLLKRLRQKYNGQIKDWLLAANPDGWSREILERFRVIQQCFNHKRLGAGIIAEANPAAPVQQQVIAEAFGIRSMVHVALNEDESTISAATQNLAEYTQVFGRDNLSARTEVSGQEFLCIMDPQSDSQKGWGMFIKPQQRSTQQSTIDLALTMRTPTYIKRGTGMSYARGGMAPYAVPRDFVNALAAMEKGLENMSEDDVCLLQQMASFVSLTIQGRDHGIRLGTPAQVYDMLDGIVTEIQTAALAIEDSVDLDIAAPAPAAYSPMMRYVLSEAEQACRAEYQEMRQRQSRQLPGQNRLDLYMQEVGALEMAEHAGVGARKAARKMAGEGRAETRPVTSLRAIGSDIAMNTAESCFNGSYTLGMFLSRLHQKYKKGDIGKADLAAFWNDAFYMQQVFPNAFVALANADYEHGFDQIEKGKKQWLVGDLLTVARTQYKGLSDNCGFHAVLAMDAIRAASYTEALAVTAQGGAGIGFDAADEEIIAALYKNGDRLKALRFGPRTHDKFPDIAPVQAAGIANGISRAALHEYERRLRAGNVIKPELLFHAACAHRTQGPYNMGILMDRSGLGSRPDASPSFDLIRERHYDAAAAGPRPQAERTHTPG